MTKCDFCESFVEDPCMTDRESWTCPIYLDDDDFWLKDHDDFWLEDDDDSW